MPLKPPMQSELELMRHNIEAIRERLNRDLDEMMARLDALLPAASEGRYRRQSRAALKKNRISLEIGSAMPRPPYFF